MKQAMYKLRTQDSAFACTIKAANDFHFATQVPCDYELDTIWYAAYHYLKHSPGQKDPLIREAVKLGLSLGKCRRRSHVILTRAGKLELPGDRAKLYLSVGQGEIVIKKVVVQD